MANEHPIRFLLPTILVSVALIAVPLLFDYVPDRHRGVVTRPDGSVRLLEPGLHFRVLGLHPRPVAYPLHSMTLDGTAELRSRDGVPLRGSFTVTLGITPSELLNFHRQRGDRRVLTALREESAASLREAARHQPVEVFFGPEPGPVLWNRFAARIGRIGLTPLGLFLDPQDLETGLRVADGFGRRNLAGSARGLLEALVSRYPRSSEAHLRLARVYDLLGEETLAEEMYLQALYLDPTREEAMAWIYQEYLQSGDLGRLEALLTASMEKVTPTVQHHLWLASVQFARKDYSATEEVLRKGLEQYPGNPEILLNLSWVYLEREQYTEAMDLIEEIVADHPDNFRAQAHLGVALAGLARYEEAIDRFLEAARIGGPSVDLFNRLAGTYHSLGEDDQAARYLRESLRLAPEQPEQKALLEELEAAPPDS